jgi:RNA polymerase sigma-70 factor (ECF subfamily)
MKGRRSNDQSWMEVDSKFHTTEWTQVLGSSLSRSIMGELYKKYRKPLYLYLRGRGFNDEKAKDLIQGFFTDKVLGSQLFQKADPKKGKFRTFLLTAIHHYVIDQIRIEGKIKTSELAPNKTTHAAEPVIEFNRAWAYQLVQTCLQELELECRSHRKEKHWELFRLWLLDPDLEGGKTKMDDLCSQLGIETLNKAYCMVFSLKDRFRRILRGHIRCYGFTESEVDQEIMELLDFLSKKSQRI